MLQQVAVRLTETLLKKKVVGEEDREIYIYGFETMLSTAVNLLLILTIGLLANLLFETIIFLVSFAALRVYCGGYHAKNHFGCISTFIFIYSIAMAGMMFFSQHGDTSLPMAASILSFLFILKVAPIEHENRPFVDNEFKKFRRISRMVASVEAGAVIIISLFFPDRVRLAFAITMAMLSVMFILALAKIIERKR